MLLITCPICGAEGDETDFHYGGQAHIRRPATEDPANVSDDAQRDYLYIRLNPKGLHFERWRCDRGCSKWFHMARDTVTMKIEACYGVTELPPASLIAQIPPSNPWYGFFNGRSTSSEPEGDLGAGGSAPTDGET